LRRLVPTLRDRGVTLVIADLPDESMAELKSSDLVAVIGEQNIYAGLRDMIEGYRNAD